MLRKKKVAVQIRPLSKIPCFYVQPIETTTQSAFFLTRYSNSTAAFQKNKFVIARDEAIF